MDIPLPSYDTAKKTISSRSTPPDVHPVQAPSLSPERQPDTLRPVWICPDVEEGRPQGEGTINLWEDLVQDPTPSLTHAKSSF